MDTQNVLKVLKDVIAERSRPDGSPYFSLLYQDEKKLAEETGFSNKQIQLLALEHDIVPERYARNQMSLSNMDQIKLLRAHVAIIGLGGLGGTVTEILARVGVGALTLVDGDSFEDSNLNRQLLSSVDDLGRMKTEVAAGRVKSLNPAVEVRTVADFLNRENCAELLQSSDLAVDCLDTISDRFILEQGCRSTGIPMVSAAIGGTSGQVTVVYPEDQGLSQIYGDRRQSPSKGVETKLGTLPYTAISMAAIECAEVVMLVIGKSAQLRNRLFITDLTDYSVDIIDFH